MNLGHEDGRHQSDSTEIDSTSTPALVGDDRRGPSTLPPADSVPQSSSFGELQESEIQPVPVPVDLDGLFTSALARLEEAYKDRLADRARGAYARDAAKEEVKRALGSDRAAVYGEVLPATAIAMLSRVGARPGQRYYDIGSGTGKTPVLAWLLGLEAIGVELVSTRWGVACEALGRLRNTSVTPLRGSHMGGNLRFFHASFQEVDFSDADIIFTDSVMFPQEIMEDFGDIARRAKPGTRVISAARSKKKASLLGPGFDLVDRFIGPTTWASDSIWTVHVVNSSATERKDVLPDASYRRPLSVDEFVRTRPTDACGMFGTAWATSS